MAYIPISPFQQEAVFQDSLLFFCALFFVLCFLRGLFFARFALCAVLGVRCSMYGVRCSVLGARCAVYGVRCAVLGARCSVCVARCVVCGVRCYLIFIQPPQLSKEQRAKNKKQIEA